MAQVALKRSEQAFVTIHVPTRNVYSSDRHVQSPRFEAPPVLRLNTRLQMDGLELLAALPPNVVPVAFFDPQYRGILDKLQYGNEGKNRGKRRCDLAQMSEETIAHFVRGIDRVLIPSGHMFLWMDKYHLLNGFREWMVETDLDVVDLISWDKSRMGMGYRSRRTTEYCLVIQKVPRKAKGVWKTHNILDTWRESVTNGPGHPHRKPIGLQSALIEAVSNEGDIVVDPAAGDFTVLQSALKCGRNFLGCDLRG